MRSIRAVGLSRSVLCASGSSIPASLAIARASPLLARHALTAPHLQLQQQARGIVNAPKVPMTSVNFDQELKMLNEQRSARPISPHMTIYQPQLTWYGSIFNRITGAGLSVGLYGFALAYAAAPLIGATNVLSSAYLTGFVAGLPFWLKLTLKAPLALAASFHTFNGFRHLGWDWGYFLSLKGAYTSGYIVIGLTALSTVGLCML
ncbi:hypothetical protein K437DRAFT_267772 [Tilletiaria anomala UBC 951]|uniref:Cytochrome b560 subunit of succinate dehydrogenase n=1 Tax=Tilletiaria anomala (strain ATCC 24038 / CBS 436.72 / UBC 951) TaxID=1037660 RepID=A0A066W5A4_TILAU|nr:uncharacterized protein K437DRAFT_267772 [Tilletiaria anomala UBC 951]KDN47728.1 hypothetical protein K437DRAFT_267772 [Tilletiaria anomala UBC 951]